MRGLIILFRVLMLVFVALSCGLSQAQCPHISFNARNDHTPAPIYHSHGWNTVVTCSQKSIMLDMDYVVTTQHFNGIYLVEEIDYNPPDSTFHQGTLLANITQDDRFDNAAIQFDFPFSFFGKRRTSATVGANGIITFTGGAAGQSCPWSYDTGLPWNDNDYNAPSPLTYMRDAIYGIYEDTDPNSTTGIGTSAGIYKDVSPDSDYPCRHVTVSWWNMSQFSCNEMKETYQMVFYEGSNIIEVHVKNRSACTSWNDGNGIIGIQNATGETQESTMDNPNGTYTDYILPNSPGFFVPSGIGNPFTRNISRRAWRFTPQGTTDMTVGIYMLEDSGALVEIGTEEGSVAADRTAAHYMDSTKTSCVVYPTVPTRYVVLLQYTDATGIEISLSDTINVGVDDGTLYTLGSPSYNATTNRVEGDGTLEVQFNLQWPDDQRASDIEWDVNYKNGSQLLPMAEVNYRLSPDKRSLVILPIDGVAAGVSDTIEVSTLLTFANGCSRNESMLYVITPPDNIWLPNIFTPTHGTNTRFALAGTGIVFSEMYIYNRRGAQIVKLDDATTGWDGNDMKGNKCPTGVYTYILKYRLASEPDDIKTKTGTVTIVR